MTHTQSFQKPRLNGLGFLFLQGYHSPFSEKSIMTLREQYLPEYRVWLQMRDRCRNPNNKNYGKYGGRGIKVCEEWDSFSTFLADMGARPSPELTLDRIDNDGDYCPSNCRWATRKQQQRNNSLTRILVYKGEEKALGDWADQFGHTPDLVRERLNQHGWTVEEALETPVIEAATFTYQGKTQTLPKWAKEIGIPRRTLQGRIYDFGWDLEKAFTTPSGKVK